MTPLPATTTNYCGDTEYFCTYSGMYASQYIRIEYYETSTNIWQYRVTAG